MSPPFVMYRGAHVPQPTPSRGPIARTEPSTTAEREHSVELPTSERDPPPDASRTSVAMTATRTSKVRTSRVPVLVNDLCPGCSPSSSGPLKNGSRRCLGMLRVGTPSGTSAGIAERDVAAGSGTYGGALPCPSPRCYCCDQALVIGAEVPPNIPHRVLRVRHVAWRRNAAPASQPISSCLSVGQSGTRRPVPPLRAIWQPRRRARELNRAQSTKCADSHPDDVGEISCTSRQSLSTR